MNYLVSKIVTFLTEHEVISSESDVQDFYRYGTLSKGQLLKATTTHNRNTSYKYSARTLVMKDNRVFKDIQSEY